MSTILIIDDTHENCEALSLNFDAAGYGGQPKIIVDSLEKGLQAIRENPNLRVILLDLNLPGVTPEAAQVKVYEELRKVDNRKAIVIPMSVYPKSEIESRIAGHPMVISSSKIMNSVTGPEALSNVMKTAEAQVQRTELQIQVEQLEKKISELQRAFDDPFLAIKIFSRNIFVSAIALTIIFANYETVSGLVTQLKRSLLPQSQMEAPSSPSSKSSPNSSPSSSINL